MSAWPPSGITTGSVVPPGVCMLHGSFAGAFCPTCSTAALVPGLNKPAAIRWPQDIIDRALSSDEAARRAEGRVSP